MGCMESVRTRKTTAATASRANDARKRYDDVNPEMVAPTISRPTGKRARRMNVTSAREPTETLKADQDCSSFCIWKEVSCRTNSEMSLPVARVLRNPWTKARTLALGCPAKAFSATPMGEPGTKASSLARISPSLVNAGKTRAPIAVTRLNPSCSVGFASWTNTERVIRKNGSSASAALLLELERERRTTSGIACTTPSDPTMRPAWERGRSRKASASTGAGKTRSETTKRE